MQTKNKRLWKIMEKNMENCAKIPKIAQNNTK